MIIVGAGPTGLILGLLLAKQGIHVDILDPGATLDKQPRAAHYASPAAYELDRAGVLDDVTARGINHKKMIWRKVDTDIVAIMRLDRMPEERKRHSLVVLPLGQLGEILYEHLQRQPTVSVRWSHRVVKVGQDGDKAWVDVETGDSKKRFEADYALGCDGASSTVRRELFGSEYPGETLDAQLVATNVHFPPIPSQFLNSPTKGLLQLRLLQLHRHKLHHPPQEPLHGCVHHCRRPLPRNLRRHSRPHARRIYRPPTNALQGDPPRKPQTRRLPDHEHQSISDAAAVRTVVSNGTGSSCCGCGACL